MEMQGIQCRTCGDVIYGRAPTDHRKCSCGDCWVKGNRSSVEFGSLSGAVFDEVEIDLEDITAMDLLWDFGLEHDQYGLICEDDAQWEEEDG